MMVFRIQASVRDRILLRSEISENGCWVYRGTIAEDGYGRIQVGHQSKRAHRIMYEESVGPIPDGLVVMHSCDNPPCINPAHLSVGTQAENIADRDRKMRGRRKRRSDSKLSLHQCLELASRISNGERAVDLATEYGVSKTAVNGIKNKVKDGWI